MCYHCHHGHQIYRSSHCQPNIIQLPSSISSCTSVLRGVCSNLFRERAFIIRGKRNCGTTPQKTTPLPKGVFSNNKKTFGNDCPLPVPKYHNAVASWQRLSSLLPPSTVPSNGVPGGSYQRFDAHVTILCQRSSSCVVLCCVGRREKLKVERFMSTTWAPHFRRVSVFLSWWQKSPQSLPALMNHNINV